MELVSKEGIKVTAFPLLPGKNPKNTSPVIVDDNNL